MKTSPLLRIFFMSLVCVALTGCLHKKVVVVPRVAQTPVPIEKAPEPRTPPVITPVPLTPAPLPAVKVPERRPRKVHKKVSEPETSTAPVQAASAGVALDPGAAIGSLAVGGDDAPEKRQQVEGMIAELDRRLKGLGSAMLNRHKEGITRVRYFERQAKTALGAGDVEGAVTLMTKATVLLDDLVK